MGMVIRRKERQVVMVGDSIKIEVVAIHEREIVMRVTAPPNIRIVYDGPDMEPKPTQFAPCCKRIPDAIDRGHPNHDNDPAPSIRRRPR